MTPNTGMRRRCLFLVFALMFSFSACRAPEQQAEKAYQKGLAFKELQQVQLAEEQFRAALTLSPHYLAARLELGKLLCNRREFRQGLKEFLTAAEYADTPQLSSLIGYAHEQLGHAALAETWYRRAIAQAPRLTDVRLRLADLLETQGRRREAADMMQEALRISPYGDEADRIETRSELLRQTDDPDAHYALADIYIREGRILQGIQEYQAAMPSAPNDPYAAVNLAIFCLDRKQYAAALTYFQKARDAGLDAKLEVHAGLAVAHEQLGQFGEAAQEYRLALQIDPEWHELRLKVAEMLKKSGQKAAAADELEQIFYLSQHHPSLRLGAGYLPTVNLLWEEILRLRGEASRKTVVEMTAFNQYSAVVTGLVNERATAALLIEEQAEYVILSQPFAAALGLEITPDTSEVLFDLNGYPASAPLVNLPSLKIGALEVRNLPAVIWNLSDYPGIDGILGKSFLKHFRVEIRYNERLFILTKL